MQISTCDLGLVRVWARQTRLVCFTRICTGTDKAKNLSLITLSVHSLLND